MCDTRIYKPMEKTYLCVLVFMVFYLTFVDYSVDIVYFTAYKMHPKFKLKYVEKYTIYILKLPDC